MARQKGKTKGKRGSQGQNRSAGIVFLEKNKTKEGVVCLPSGLQYLVINNTTEGLSPGLNDEVVVDQRIKLVDGKVVRDTFIAREKDTFVLNEVIPGLQEGLQLMHEGSRWRFFIPSELAWGKQGIGKSIGPNSILIADIWLHEVRIT